METRINEIADGIYRLSTNIPEAAPGGFTFNQFIVKADEPLLFHCGMRQLFPLVSEAAARSSRSTLFAGSRSGTSRRTSAGP
jgi:hypothetical protein